MASEEAIVRRRALARQDLDAAERRIADVCGVAVDSADPPSRDPDIAAIQQLERVTALLTAIAGAWPAPAPEPPADAPDSRGQGK